MRNIFVFLVLFSTLINANSVQNKTLEEIEEIVIGNEIEIISLEEYKQSLNDKIIKAKKDILTKEEILSLINEKFTMLETALVDEKLKKSKKLNLKLNEDAISFVINDFRKLSADLLILSKQKDYSEHLDILAINKEIHKMLEAVKDIDSQERQDEY